MDGIATFKIAVKRLSESTIDAVAAAGLELDDIDLFVYHQANARILKAVGERLELDPAKVVDYIAQLGNTSAASIPLTLCAARARTAACAPGHEVLLAAFGAGFTWGAGVMEWSGDRLSRPESATRSSPAPRAGSAPRSRRRSPPTAGPSRSTTAPTRPARNAVVEAIEAAGGTRDGASRPTSPTATPRRCSTRLEDALGPGARRSSTTPASAPTGSRPSSTDDDWDRVIDTNLSRRLPADARRAAPMIKARYGRIVNIASVVGPRANAGQSNYAAAKAGLIGMTKTVAAEVARRGVTVNAVAPGFIATDMTAELATDEIVKAIPARRRARRRRSPPACASSPPTTPPTSPAPPCTSTAA